MTPLQKLQWLIIDKRASWGDVTVPAYPCQEIDGYFTELDDADELQDAISEVRSSGEETGLPCPYSRHYESKAVAAELPDGSWVGWTYWYGGGKYGQPEAVEWMADAYDVDCKKEERLVVVREFSAKVTA